RVLHLIGVQTCALPIYNRRHSYGGYRMSFKVVSIGCGRHAASVHGPSWSKLQAKNERVTLAACCDIDEQIAIQYRDRFGYSRHYTDISTMLDTERPDAVSLVAPVD